MGYSISVELPSVQARDKMLSFLLQQDWNDLAQATAGNFMDEGVVLYPVAGPDLAYAPNKDDGVDEDRLLGFNGSLIPHTAWAVIAWVATQYAKPGQKPVFWYDSEQLECEITQDPDVRTGSFMVDPGGVFLPTEDKIPGLPTLLFASKMKKKVQAHVQEREWIQGLHDRWKTQPDPASGCVGSKKPKSP